MYNQRFKRGGGGQANNDNQGETDVDVRMLVHQSQAGCIIGKGGLKVKELREVSLYTIKNRHIRQTFGCDSCVVFL